MSFGPANPAPNIVIEIRPGQSLLAHGCVPFLAAGANAGPRPELVTLDT